jgi:hypothetical protein
MIDWWRQRSSFMRLLAYAVAAILVLVAAAGMGAMAALVVGDPPGEQGGSAQRKQAD